MKRMSEVFDFNEPIGYPMSWSDEQVKAGNKAIKNADNLADALDDVVKAWKFLCTCNGYDEDHLVEFENAKKALQAYRGTK